MAGSLKWWQTGVIYQMVVPSFLDTNGTGWGDLRGIIERLDYLKWLGVHAVWLSPLYPSPLEDMGYDVQDFTDVHPHFGTLADLDELIAKSHQRELKVILDWVPNHTSSEHPWFLESRSSRDNPKRDWYLWRDARPDGSPPNNWISVFGGSVWEWDGLTKQYYLHTFLNKQPDLNWRHPDVQQAMLSTLRFWLDRGVDGFRIDAMDLMLKDEQFRDNPLNPDFSDDEGPDSQLLPDHTRDQPGMREIAMQIRKVADAYDDRMLAAELYLPIEKAVRYYGDDADGIHLPLNVKLAWTNWNPQELAEIIQKYLDHVPSTGWPTWMLSTHDCARIVARCGLEQARVAAMLLMTLPGTPTHYYGEEIGMRGTPIPSHDARDPQGRFTGRNRDPERTPMQWSGELHAGFSTTDPWLPISDDFQTANVAVQSDDPYSMLTLYRHLIQLRASRPTLETGHLEGLVATESAMAYRRVNGAGEILVLLNFSSDPLTWHVDASPESHVLLSTCLDCDGQPVENEVSLRAHEGLVIQLRG
jgi:alpha-glucosidase